jgi:hypothetical protein
MRVFNLSKSFFFAHVVPPVEGAEPVEQDEDQVEEVAQHGQPHVAQEVEDLLGRRQRQQDAVVDQGKPTDPRLKRAAAAARFPPHLSFRVLRGVPEQRPVFFCLSLLFSLTFEAAEPVVYIRENSQHLAISDPI